MKIGLFKIYKVINNIIFKLKNPRIDLSIFADISPYFLKNLKNKENIILGNTTIIGNVTILEGTKFIDKSICSGDITIGRYTSINGPNTFILSQINSIKIGSFCSIASGVRIQEYFHEYRRPTTYYINRHILKKDFLKDTFSKGSIHIEDDVWIGANVVIMSGVKVGRGSIIGAGSIVTKDIPSYSIVGGNPAKVIKKRFSKEIIEELEKSKWWTWTEKKIKQNENFFEKFN